MMNSPIGVDKKSVGYYFRIFDLGKNRLQSTDDFIDEIEVRVCFGRSKQQLSLHFNLGRQQREICRDIFARSRPVAECEREWRSDQRC